jgi:hypothetical protein
MEQTLFKNNTVLDRNGVHSWGGPGGNRALRLVLETLILLLNIIPHNWQQFKETKAKREIIEANNLPTFQ